MADRERVIVSSSVRDLADYREAVREALLRGGFDPLMMEHSGALDESAIEHSIALVDQADLYLGIVGVRYGSIPEGETRSFTEVEYDRAVERDILRLLFLFDRARGTFRFADLDDDGDHRAMLDALHERMAGDRVAGFFVDPADLRLQVQEALLARRDGAPRLHAVTDAPAPPQAYVAHPYALMETSDVVGRQKELNWLTEWIVRDETPVLLLEAVGGMGKSALTWKWFNEIAPRERALGGRMWWSFYESDANYDNFVTRALAYVTLRSFGEVAELPIADREEQLLRALDERPFLIVLDGVERMLRAYAGRTVLQSMERDAGGASPAARRDHEELRRTLDPRAGMFLRRLARTRASRVLISTRLLPSDLQTDTDQLLPGVEATRLEGLSDDDAVALWRELDVSGSREELVTVFNTFGNYPLLVRVLAGEVARYRAAPGDFAAWRAAHPGFDPFSLPLRQVRSHVLEYALEGLADSQRDLLNTIAAFTAPASYEILHALLVDDDRTYADAAGLDRDLTELEDRGLVGWDRRGNRYDQHPIVRGVAWTGLDPSSRETIHEAFERYYSSLPDIDADEPLELDELYGPLEHYNALLHLGRHGDAWNLLSTQLFLSLLRTGQWGSLVDQLERMLDPATGLPWVAAGDDGVGVYLLLAMALQASSRLEQAIGFWQRVLAARLDELSEDGESRGALLPLTLLSLTLRDRGRLADATAAAERAVAIIRSKDPANGASELYALGAVLSTLGQDAEARRLLTETRQTSWLESGLLQLLGADELVWHELRRGDLEEADRHANGLGDGGVATVTLDAMARGAIALARGEHELAAERLELAFQLVARFRIVAHEIRALYVAAELEIARSRWPAARELVDRAMVLAERGPRVLDLADLSLMRARIEELDGERAAAIEWAGQAYRFAWADGPDHSYRYVLERAGALLTSYGEDLPTDLERHEVGHDDGAYEERVWEAERDRTLAQLDDPLPSVRRAAAFAVTCIARLKDDPSVRRRLRQRLRDADPGVREAALATLGAWDDDEVLKHATDMLGDRDAVVRRQAVAELTRLAQTKVWAENDQPAESVATRLTAFERCGTVRALLGRLVDPDAPVREATREVLSMLWDWPPPEAAGKEPSTPEEMVIAIRRVVLGAIREDWWPTVAEHRQAAWQKLGIDDALIDVAAESTPSVRASVARLLGNGTTPEARAQLHALLADDAAEVRAEAMLALLKVDGSEALLEPARRWRDDEDGRVRAAALEVLLANGRSCDDPELEPFLADPSKEVGLVLAQRVQAVESEEEAAALVGLIGHRSPDVRAVACFGCQYLLTSVDKDDDSSEPDHPEFARPLVEALARCVDARGRQLAAGALDPTDDDHARTLVRLLEDPADAVVEEAAEQLVKAAEPISLDELGELLERVRSGARWAVATAMAASPDERVPAFMGELLDDDAVRVRAVAAGALPPDAPSVAETREEAIRHSDRAALTLIAQLRRQRRVSDLPLLLELAETSDGTVRQAAVQTAIAVDPSEDHAVARRLLDAPDAELRTLTFEVLVDSLTMAERQLICTDLDGAPPFLDLREPIPDEHVAKAAASLEEAVEVTRRRFEALAKRIPLRLEPASG